MKFKQATFLKRAVAFTLDFITVTIADSLISQFIYIPNELQKFIVSGVIGFILIPFIYWVYVPKKFGATLGKKMLNLKVVGVDFNPDLSWGQLIKREALGRFCSLIVFGLGYFWSLFDKDGFTWHDILSKTRVVEITE